MWKAVLGEERAPTVFVGHSMGGAIATWAVNRQASGDLPPLCEGSADVTAISKWRDSELVLATGGLFGMLYRPTATLSTCCAGGSKLRRAGSH